MAKATIYVYSQSYHALPHWKCLLQCCTIFPSINIPDQETDDQYPNIIPSIRFHIYHLIVRCTTHGRLPLNEEKVFGNRILPQNNQQKYSLEKSL